MPNEPQDVTPSKPTFVDRDLTPLSGADRLNWINQWLEQYRSVELFYKSISGKRHLIARLWQAAL